MRAPSKRLSGASAHEPANHKLNAYIMFKWLAKCSIGQREMETCTEPWLNWLYRLQLVRTHSLQLTRHRHPSLAIGVLCTSMCALFDRAKCHITIACTEARPLFNAQWQMANSVCAFAKSNGAEKATPGKKTQTILLGESLFHVYYHSTAALAARGVCAVCAVRSTFGVVCVLARNKMHEFNPLHEWHFVNMCIGCNRAFIEWVRRARITLTRNAICWFSILHAKAAVERQWAPGRADFRSA